MNIVSFIRIFAFGLILNIPDIYASSAWLPKAKTYKYNISFFGLSSSSEKTNEAKYASYKILTNKVQKLELYKQRLINKIISKENAISIEKIALTETELDDLYKLSAINYKIIYYPDIDNIHMSMEEYYRQELLSSVNREIDKLRKALAIMLAYSDEEFLSNSLEYGITDNTSFGVSAYYKKDLTKKTQSGDFFLKRKIFQNAKYVISCQYKIKVTNDNSRIGDLIGKEKITKITNEISLLGGYSTFKKKNEIFTDNAIGIGKDANGFIKSKYFYISILEGIKFPNGFIISNFTKYSITNKSNIIYKKTIYDQISIAKEIVKPNSNKVFAIQIGYFWEKSKNFPIFNSSGLVLSLWSEF